MLLPSFSFVIFSLVTVCHSGAPIVKTNYGKIKGLEVPTSTGGAEVFLAIPFAKPPVGNLRFEKPQSPEPFKDVYQATQFRNDCSPHYRLVAQFSSYSGEDCLTLNVIKPKKVTEKLPVLVWIHGGGYAIGSASDHGYEFFAKRYTTQNIIVVTIQYRLGFLGFLATDKVANLGLFDQVAALKYIKENIEHFGGDPDRITLWGYSAGAASVSQLTISPYSRDLYQHAIIMSGGSLSGWATGSTTKQHTAEFMKDAGCDSIECLKQKDLHELFNAQEVSGHNTGTIDILKWSPVIDGDFFPKHPSKLIEEAPNKPTLIGLSDKEGSYFTVANQGRVLSDFGLSPQEIQDFNEQKVIDAIKEKYLHANRFGSNEAEALETLKNHYLHKNRPENPEHHFFLDKYTELFSDVSFNVPIVREIQKRVESNNNQVYTYLFNHYSDKIWKKHVPVETRGSLHANEYHYLFDMNVLGKIDFKKEPDQSIRNDFINLVISFAKTGKPEINGIEWNPVVDKDKISYLNIGTDGHSINTGLFAENLAVWNDLASRTNFDIVDPTLSDSIVEQKDEL